MDYLNANNPLPSFVDKFHNKFEVPVIALDDGYYVNCDKNSSDYNKKEERHGRESYQNMEEKTEEAEELGNHGQLCKCGSNSEICEEFINSFSLQDILSNFELPSSSSTDEDDETSVTKKQNEDEEELNLIDFLNNTQFLNDFVNRNSIKIDKVFSDTVDLLTKNNKKKKNVLDDNHQILDDNQIEAPDNQIFNAGFENNKDNHNEMGNEKEDSIANDGSEHKILGDDEGDNFTNEKLSTARYVQNEDESQSNPCAKYSSTGQDTASTIPLPSFDTFRSKNITSQFANVGDNNDNNMKENAKGTIHKCVDMFENYHDEMSPGQEHKVSRAVNNHSIMGININEQINEFERYTEEPNILEHLLSNNRDNALSLCYERNENMNNTTSRKNECQDMVGGETQVNYILNSEMPRLDNRVQTGEHGAVPKATDENIEQHVQYNTSNTKITMSKLRDSQYEEVIDSGNFWVNKTTDSNEKPNDKNIPISQSFRKDTFRVPIVHKHNQIIKSIDMDTDENKMNKSVKILTKTHLLNSMQFDKNQCNFMSSPHFLLLLTKPIKFPGIEGQCCSKNLSADTKSKLINFQNNIRSQIRNAQLLQKKNKSATREENHRIKLDLNNFNQITPRNANINKSEDTIVQKNIAQSDSVSKSENQDLNLNPLGRQQHDSKQDDIKNSQEKSNQNVDITLIKNKQNTITETKQSNCKDLPNIINKTENYRFDQEFKILTLRTENADCINKKVKLQNVSTMDSNIDTRSVSNKTKLKAKTKYEKVQKTNDHHFNYHHQHHHHHHYHRHIHHKHDKDSDDKNNPSLRRSERIRVKKEKKQMKYCLLFNMKKTNNFVTKKTIPMSLVDKTLHLKTESAVKYHFETSDENPDKHCDLIAYKSCFIEDVNFDGQIIKKLKYTANIEFKADKVESPVSPHIRFFENNNNTPEVVHTSTQGPIDQIDKYESKTDSSNPTSVDNNNEMNITGEKKNLSLKARYPALEALIASTSNEVKPIIRKRKRVKFDKSKYEKIKKINKEKENNIERNKVLLLNLNKNNQNKVMQNLLLIRDHNNQTHLLFTKPVENDKIQIVPENMVAIEKEKLIKLNENNPNFINKKIDFAKEEITEQQKIRDVNTKYENKEKESINNASLKDPNFIDETSSFMDSEQKINLICNEETRFDPECLLKDFGNKDGTPYLTFMNPIGQVPVAQENKVVRTITQIIKDPKDINSGELNNTDMTTQGYSQNESFGFGFYSTSQDYDKSYRENIVNNVCKVSKSFQSENIFTDSTGVISFQEFSETKSPPARCSYYENSTSSVKDTSTPCSVSEKIIADKISHKFMKDFIISKGGNESHKKIFVHENKNCEESFESDLNQIYQTDFLENSHTASIWDSENVNFRMNSMILSDLNTARKETTRVEKITISNELESNISQFPNDSITLQDDIFQQANSKYTHAQSRTFDIQELPVPSRTFLGEKSNKFLAKINELRDPLSPSAENCNTFLDVIVSNPNVETSPLNFTPDVTVSSPDDVTDRSFHSIFGGDDTCWSTSNSTEWSSSQFQPSMGATSNSNAIYDDHLQLSEEIMKKSLQEDETMKLHVCTIEECNCVFQSQAEWEEHARMHAVQRPFGCRYCDKAFKTSCDLSKHSAIHNGDRPYKCNFTSCGRHFRTHAQRQIHERCHLDSRKPYSCHVCGRSFISNTHKNNHLRIHYGLKPYVCHVEGCKRKFVDLSSLKKHTKIHTQQTFHCNLCNKTYKHQQSIITHYQEIHGVVVQDKCC